MIYELRFMIESKYFVDENLKLMSGWNLKFGI